MTEREFLDSLYEEPITQGRVMDSGPVHPALTTPFTDYTVTEALLLFALLFAFAVFCVRILKGGFPWLK